jgi:hypothetical protein
VAHDVERVLADIDTNHSSCSVQCLGQGVLLGLDAPSQLLLLAGREHGRTIPFRDTGQHFMLRAAIGSGNDAAAGPGNIRE